MNKKEITLKSNEEETISVNIDNVPEIISSQIDSISKLEKQVEASDKSAKKAMEYVNNQMSRYEIKGWWIFEHRSGNTKDIVEDTQEAVLQLAKTHQVTIEALKKSFDFQRKLAKVSKYLFDLGCANITVNRIAVRAIEKKLSGAADEQISELAKQEMMSVVKQLKEQENILTKYEELKAKVKTNSERLNEKDCLDVKQSKEIDTLKDKMSEKVRIDAEQSQRLEDLEALLENKDTVDQRQDEAISKNKSEIADIKSILNRKDSLDDEQTQRISKNEEAIKILYDFMKTKDELDKKQSKEIEEIKKRKNNVLPIIAMIFSAIAIAVSIVGFVV